jgi:hypothetical protein
MLRVSAAAVEGEREQDLIGPDARHGSLVYRLRKDRRPLTDGQGRNSSTSLRTGRGRNTATGLSWTSTCSGVMSSPPAAARTAPSSAHQQSAVAPRSSACIISD